MTTQLARGNVITGSPRVDVAGPSLTWVDELVRDWRIRKIRRHVPRETRLLDVGCHDGALFRAVSERVVSGVGIDPSLERSTTEGRFRFIRGSFPLDGLERASFDVVTFLAVLEHVDPGSISAIRAECERLLAPGGRVLVTVPSPKVDSILHRLERLGMIAGISLHEHHGFDPERIPELLGGGALTLRIHRRFELGLNHLFVFTKSVV